MICADLLGAAELPEARPVDGEPFRAALEGFDADGKVQFGAGAPLASLPLADLATWGAFVEPARGTQLLLAGGGVIVADVLEIDKDRLLADLRHAKDHGLDAPPTGEIKLPLESLLGVIFHAPADRSRRDPLIARVSSAAGDADRVILDNGDELTGAIQGLSAPGGALDAGIKKLSLETAGGRVEVEAAKVAAIAFNPALGSRPRASGLRTIVGFQDGSRVMATSLSGAGETARLKLVSGLELEAKISAIVALQTFGGRVTYLSDLKSSGYKHLPYLQLSWPFRADRSALGSPLRAAGKLYLKGLGMHSAARLTYDLDRPYQQFAAELAVDDETAGRGSVVFRVFVDDGAGNGAFKYTSPVIRGGDPPTPISVDLTGAKRLSLLVEYSDRGDELDHADWLNARLVK
jgi:hypothetical protein